MRRQFQRTPYVSEEGHKGSAVVFTCCKCGATESLRTNKNSGSCDPETIANKLRKTGWIISSREGRDVCPKCAHAKSQTTEKENNVVELKTVVVEPPREMTKEDRRLIFAKINDVYLDETQGYSVGWSDRKVAEDLGVPFAWVRNIREDNFGSEGAPEEFLKLIADAKAIVKEFDAHEQKVLSTLSQFSGERIFLSDKIKDVNSRIAALEAKFK